MARRQILLLSDSTGNLGERILLALTSQFPKGNFTLKIHNFIRDIAECQTLLNELDVTSSIVFHTVLHADMKKTIEKFCTKKKIPQFDLTGSAMNFLQKAASLKSKFDPDRLHEQNTEYEKRIAALNFTVEHDDGIGLGSLSQADIVLLGVSRTSKTPTSIFLSGWGYKVANIPLVPGVDIYSHLAKYPKLHVVGLLIDHNKLQEIRMKRADEEKIPGVNYIDTSAIRDEIKEAKKLYEKLKCPVIDVTHRAVEETAALVVKKLGLR